MEDGEENGSFHLEAELPAERRTVEILSMPTSFQRPLEDKGRSDLFFASARRLSLLSDKRSSAVWRSGKGNGESLWRLWPALVDTSHGGEDMPAGSFVSSGSPDLEIFIGAWPLDPGQTWRLHYDTVY